MRGYARAGKTAVFYILIAAALATAPVGGTAHMTGAYASSVRASGSTEVIVHYHRFLGDYSGWNLWLWPHKPESKDGASYEFTGTDDFGVVGDAMVPGASTEVGIIVRLRNWEAKDVEQDRFIDMSSGKAEVWLIQGDPTIYSSRSGAQTALVNASKPKLRNSYLDGPSTAFVALTVPVTLSGSGANGFTITDETTRQQIPVVSVDRGKPVRAVLVGDLQTKLGAKKDWDPSDFTTLMKETNPDLFQFTGMLPEGNYQYKVALDGTWAEAYPASNITLSAPAGGATVTFSYVPSTHAVYDSINNPTAALPTGTPSIKTDLVKLTLGSAPDVTHTLKVHFGDVAPVTVVPRLVLNDSKYYYGGNDLGAVYGATATSFRLWAPTASSVRLTIYKNEAGDVLKRLSMRRSVHGTWYAKVGANLHGKLYIYEVTNRGDVENAVDPYAKGIGVNGTSGMVVDLQRTNPPRWRMDHYIRTPHPEDAVIYEVHVRDFSINRRSGMKYKGKFLAFTERGTRGPHGVKTGVDSLKELGVTHVELLPVYGFATIDENNPDRQYNWGYDPRDYNAPEGAYATTPHGTGRIAELKRLVQSLHQRGLAVIMDVVYNHTFVTGSSDFDKIVPQYYYRTDYNGRYTNGSGVGNEVAAERPMVRKFILDSVKYWMKEYHVDGYRFDEMALLGKMTMTQASKELHAINPNTVLLGEPWGGGSSGIIGDQLLTKGVQKNLRLAVFNDDIRDGIFGSTGDRTAQGYATGDPTALDPVAKGVVGSIKYSSTLQGFTASPDETINYVTSHDNMTLWDKIKSSNPGVSEADRIKMDELAQAIVMTAQGIPFMQGGEEMLRTKQGNENSYNAGDAINKFYWDRKAKYLGVFRYYAGLIHLRDLHPAFRMTSAAMIRRHLRFLDSPLNVIQFELTGHANGDSWNNIDVILNPTRSPLRVGLPAGRWTITGTQGRIGVRPLGHAVGGVVVPALSTEILYGGEVGAAFDPTTNSSKKKMVNVTFRVRVPSNTPPGDTVFIPGNIDLLGPWDPAKQPMQNAGGGIWTVTLQIPEGTKLQYKYTRGSWEKVESWGTITGFTNRHVTISYGADGKQLVDDTATDWGKPGPDDHRAIQKWVDLPLPTSL